MRFKRLGASLLTGALSLSMILGPSITTQAHIAEKDDEVGAYENHDGFEDGYRYFIDEDKNVVKSYTKEDLEKMKENNTKEYRNLKAKLGGEPLDRLDRQKVEGKYYYFYTETTYTNTLTGKSSKDISDVSDDRKLPESVTVNEGSFYEVELKFGNGEVGITNLKSSNEKIATAVIQNESRDITTTKQKVVRESGKKNKYYYTNAYGKKIYTKKGTVINTSSGSVTIRVGGVKSGSCKLTYEVVGQDGKSTGKKKTLKVNVKDTQPFSVLTYDGKSLIQNPVIGAEDKNYIYYGKNRDKDASNNSYGYTTKAKGTIKVKMNSKNYKLLRIEAGSLFYEGYKTYTRNKNKSTYFAGKKIETKYTDEEQFNSYSGSIKHDHYVDLNGDGDYLDTVNGIPETGVSYQYKTIRNNSTLKLSKITTATKSQSKVYNRSAYKSTLRRDSAGNVEFDEDDNALYDYKLLDKNDYTMRWSYSSSMYAPTALRIYYYDKNEKKHRVFNTTIWYKNSKK